MVVPPRQEQKAIIDLVEAKNAEFSSLIDEIREAIDRLREFRTALISAAVTGKIDVRGEAA